MSKYCATEDNAIRIEEMNPTFLFTWKGTRTEPEEAYHCHDIAELAFVMSGTGKYRIEGQVYEVGEGDLLFFIKNIEAAYESLRGDTRVTSQTDKTQFEALEQFGQNLTQQAREGKLDPVIGRNEEIRRTIQVLSRRTKNNPVLIGEPGTGKTAIVDRKSVV